MKGRKKMLSFLMTVYEDAVVKRPIDDMLINKIANGDMDAFVTLYESASKSVYSFALSITKNSHDADDVLQETFLKVYENAARYDCQGKAMAWIFKIAKNNALNKIRSRAKHSDYDDGRDFDIDFSAIENAENRLLIENLFTLLCDEEKQIITLHAVSGLKHREIADILAMPISSVLSKYHRAIKKLKDAVKED